MIAIIVGLAGAAAWLLVSPGAATRIELIAPPPRDRGNRMARMKVLAARLGLRHRSRAQRALARRRVVEAVVALAAELRAGQPPAAALVHAAGNPPVWPTALAALRLGGAVSDALRLDAREHRLLASVAACWDVGAASGSGLSSSIERLAQGARRSDEVRAQLEAELAAPRATARLLSGLPLIGLGMAVALGVDPLNFLLGGPIGWGCLMGGAVLIAAGIVWTNRIATRIERQL